jgi:hypothetical protein
MTSSVAVRNLEHCPSVPMGARRAEPGATTSSSGNMRNVYRDSAAFEAAVPRHGEDFLVYRVEEHRNFEGSRALIIGTSTLLPGR